MPPVNVVFFQEGERVEMRDWLRERAGEESEKCVDRLTSLQEFGYELDEPDSKYLRGKIFELRARVNRVQLRMLYFFHGKGTAVVTHGFQKKTKKTPPIEIDRAIKKRTLYLEDPKSHTFNWEPDND